MPAPSGDDPRGRQVHSGDHPSQPELPPPDLTRPPGQDHPYGQVGGRGAPTVRSDLLEPQPSALERWRTGRIDPGWRGVAALALVAALAAALAGLLVLRSRPHEVAPPPVVAAGVPVPGSAAATAAPAAASGSAPGAQAAEVVVAVGGKVRRPGLVRLPAGSRVDDAVRAAGGARRGVDLGLVNLARRLVDGEHVLVGVPGTGPPAAGLPAQGAASSDAAAAGGAVLDLNTATAAQLDELPGIGPVLAQRIVDWRTENGRFASVDQLREVSGIGESTFAKLKSKVQA